MGLDMYLYKKTYVKNWDFTKPEHKVEITILMNGKPHPKIDVDRVSHIIEDVAYWRKANQIHSWFVNNCQDGVDDCRDAYVSIDQLNTLLSLCKEVKEDHSKASTLLPSHAGFFFGSTEYNEWYYEDIDLTIKQLTGLDPNGSYYYHSSW